VQLGPIEATFTPADASRSRQENIEALTRNIERRATQIESLSDAASLAAEIATAAALAQAVKEARETADIEPEHKARTAARHRRQTLVMPYFSFAPRG
jgi:predicted RNase H-like nuclease (RuvC/YqgF family)